MEGYQDIGASRCECGESLGLSASESSTASSFVGGSTSPPKESIRRPLLVCRLGLFVRRGTIYVQVARRSRGALSPLYRTNDYRNAHSIARNWSHYLLLSTTLALHGPRHSARRLCAHGAAGLGVSGPRLLDGGARTADVNCHFGAIHHSAHGILHAIHPSRWQVQVLCQKFYRGSESYPNGFQQFE